MIYRALVASLMAVGTALALFEWPYAYYELLRLIVCGGCLYLAFAENQTSRRIPLVVALGAAAVIFNPVLPLHLGREAWFIVDLIAAGFFVYIVIDLINYARTHPNPDDPMSRWFEEKRKLQKAEDEIQAQADAEAKAAFREATQQANRIRVERLKAFAIECGANPEDIDFDAMASALSLKAVDKLLVMRERASKGPPLDSMRDLLLLIATDAVCQRLNVDWEPLFMAVHAGEMLDITAQSPEEDDFARAVQRFHQTIDLQKWLHDQALGEGYTQQIGERILIWTEDHTEEPLYDAVGAIRQLEPMVRKYEQQIG